MIRKYILFVGVAGVLSGAANAQTGNVGIGSSINGSRLTLGGSFAGAFRAATGNTALTVDDYFLLYSGSGSATITLPAAQTGSGNFQGRVYKIRNGSTQPLSIAASGTERVDGKGTIVIAAGHTAELISSGATAGTTWKIVSAGPSTYSIDGLRSALSAGGCTSCAAYDAAAAGNWVNITAAEYTALQGIAGGGIYGVSPANMASSTLGDWSANYTVTQQFANSSQVPASNYIYALAVRTGTTPPTTMAGIKLKLSNTSQTGGYSTYPSASAATPVLASGTPSANTLYYFVMKKPASTSASGAASNTAVYQPVVSQIGRISPAGTCYYQTGDGASPTSGFPNVMLQYQVLATPTLQW